MTGLPKLLRLTGRQRNYAHRQDRGDQDKPEPSVRAVRHRAIRRSEGRGDLRMTGPSPTAISSETALRVKTNAANVAPSRMPRVS
jgi:hypothetical protein